MKSVVFTKLASIVADELAYEPAEYDERFDVSDTCTCTLV